MNSPEEDKSDSGDSVYTDAESDRNPVDILADEFARSIRRGETPSIEEYVSAHPKLESEIRAVLPTIARMEKVSRQQLSNSGTNSFPQHADLNLKKIGDFEILGQLGQGGMGIVYEALQVSLHRHVALKIISPSISSSPKQLERFKREAATAARLHHTNIVPVFGSGDENGIHYYAMQLINGTPLHQAVRSIRESKTFSFESTGSTFANPNGPKTKPSPTRNYSLTVNQTSHSADSDNDDAGDDVSLVSSSEDLLESNSPKRPANRIDGSEKQKSDYWLRVCHCIADIADALDYAHEQGVLHRDVKPSNLIMDQDGTVWITDFGLAKFDDSDGLTKTGDMVGTLRYMSPEQFNGDGDSRSDVCSLGLTLFELLVLNPAYSETRSAPLMKLKTEQPPPSPRTFEPTIPKDLETIVLKSCATLPNDRYQTAGEMRDDLVRFIEGRPISARRVTIAEQAWRWSKRNPLVASLSMLTLALIIAVAVVATIGNQQTQAALKEKEIEFERAEASKTSAERALTEAKKQKTRAEDNFSIAIEACEDIMQNIANRGVPFGIAVEVQDEEVRSFETTLTGSDVEILETLLRFFEDFAQKNEADLSFQSAQALRRVGDILQRLGRLDEAEVVYRQAVANFSKLEGDTLDESENILVRMKIFNEIAFGAKQRGDFSDAEVAIKDCQEVYEGCKAKSDEIHLEYARSLNIFTSMYTRVGYVINRKIFAARNPPNSNSQPKAKAASSANEGNANNKSRFAKNRRANQQKGRVRIWVDVNNLFAEKKSAVRIANDRAIEILDALIADDSERSEFQLELSRAYQDRVRIHRDGKDRALVRSAFQKAKSILEDLTAKHPNNPAYPFELGDMLLNLDRANLGIATYGAALKVARELRQKWPTVGEYRALYANSLVRGVVSKLNTVAPKRLEEPLRIYRQLIDEYPAYYAYKINFAQYLILVATVSSRVGDSDQANELFEEAEACLNSISPNESEDALIIRIRAELRAARNLNK